MHRQGSEAETQLMFGIHDEWQVRDLRVRRLLFGRTLASWVFKDDGPVWDDRQRHAAIPVSFVPPAQTDWLRFKANLYYHLEKVKAYSLAS
jgi:hypothetical protein